MGCELNSRSDIKVVKRMAELLKSGAAMLEHVCPKCEVPLFRLRSGEIICPSCGQRFVFVSSDEEEFRVYGDLVIREVERAAITKLSELSSVLLRTEDSKELRDIVEAMKGLLSLVESSRRIRGPGIEAGKSS